ncbi:MAG: hypothetical protein WC346_01405 [Methanogenium sp.]|jgi:hypothetical protein
MSNRLSHITGAVTTVVSSTPCKLHTLVINTTSSAAITLYNNASAAVAGDAFAVFPASAGVGTYTYDVDLTKGLTIVTAGTCDLTISTSSQGN